MRAMVQWLVLTAASLLAFHTPLAAQDETSRSAAAVADREAAEERYQRLNSAVEGLLQAQAEQQRRLQAVSEEVRKLAAQPTVNETQRVTREEFNRLVETVKELGRNQESDKKQILEEIESLGKSLSASVRESARHASSPATSETKPESKPESKPPAGRTETKGSDTPPTDKGTWHTIERKNTLSAIVAAYNEQYKPQGLKTSLKLIQEANPKLKPTALIVGQKIWIPLVPEKS